MGPPQAADIIREAFWMGVDEGALLTDRKFAGADVWATSYALAQGLKNQGLSDLIICGKQTTDGDTAQVGAEIAEFLNIPHVTNVLSIVEIKDKTIIVELDLPNGVQVAEIEFPCLITVEKDIYMPRLPSFKRKKATKDWKITTITFNNLEDKNETHYGMKGSPTKVNRVFPPESNTDRIMLEGSEQELSDKIFKIIKEKKII
jgi:electron transfer flavoprotein beta subunit